MTSRTGQQHSEIASISLGAGYKLDDNNASVWSLARSDRASIQVTTAAARKRFKIFSAFKSLTNLGEFPSFLVGNVEKTVWADTNRRKKPLTSHPPSRHRPSPLAATAVQSQLSQGAYFQKCPAPSSVVLLLPWSRLLFIDPPNREVVDRSFSSRHFSNVILIIIIIILILIIIITTSSSSSSSSKNKQQWCSILNLFRCHHRRSSPPTPPRRRRTQTRRRFRACRARRRIIRRTPRPRTRLGRRRWIRG